jgi:hypothetical protein
MYVHAFGAPGDPKGAVTDAEGPKLILAHRNALELANVCVIGGSRRPER